MIQQEPMDYVVVGASGWLGQATLDYLHGQLAVDQHQRVHAFASQRRTLSLRNGTRIEARPLTDLASLRLSRPAMVFHYAFQTKDKVAGHSLDDYIQGNRQIREHLVRFAASNSIAGVMLTSSGAVYAGLDVADMSDLAVYGRCKLEEEQAFRLLGEQFGFPVCCPRIFNLSGPYINKHELYAIASIIKACLQHQPIVLQANRAIVRSYYPVLDLISLVRQVLVADREQGAVFRTFDTVGAEVVEIGELAERCRQLLAPDVEITRPELSALSDNRYVGEGQALRDLERRFGLSCASLDVQIQQTARYLSEVVPGSLV